MKLLTGLIVEDSPITQAALKKVLETQKCKALCADSGEQAFKILNQGVQVDFAIVDMNLPGMTGAEVIRKLGKNKTWKKIIVFPYSALWDEPEDAPRMEDLETLKNWPEITDIFFKAATHKTVRSTIGKPHGMENFSEINPKLMIALARLLKNKKIKLTPAFSRLLAESLALLNEQ